jgi:murein DD-endopeptidase MepM/ murein hydrolase activator NlpD
MAFRKLHSGVSAGLAIASIHPPIHAAHKPSAQASALHGARRNGPAGAAALAVCAALVLFPDSGSAKTQHSSTQTVSAAVLPYDKADGGEGVTRIQQPEAIRLTVQRGSPGVTRLNVDSGREAAAMRTGEDRDTARLAVAEVVEGAQVVASRTTGFEGRPIDIFRPVGVDVVTPGALPSRLPVNARVSSGFGYRRHPTLGGWRAHSGVDLAAAYGSPVVATTGGTVEEADWRGGYGLLVGIRSGAVHTRYGHLSRLNVVAGQKVKPGDVIGYVGSTGRSTGPHLHYEVRVNGRAVDPMRAKAK